ncbi:anti-sigma factor family protein [Paludibaculum fermentans]|uniref:anti-sigma factor family protein n=1 Tax=Paludibaculum fermentans TaxID=1473598 RepID=UPI003EC0D7D4
MKQTELNWNCETLRENLDLYMDNHLPADAGLAAQMHLNHCVDCAAEWQSRRMIRGRLRQAVRSDTTPPFLEARIKANLRIAHRPSLWQRTWAPAAAAVLICLGSVIAYQLGALRLTTSSQESYIASVSSRIPALMRVGLGDHIHCSVFRKFPKDAPTVEELTRKMGPEYAGLIPIVRKHVPREFTLMQAHQCRYHGRRFVHLSLKSGARLISLVIAKKSDGESFEAQKVIPEFVHTDIPMYQAGVQRFEVTAFETGSHLVYLVSDLAQSKNNDLMLAMAPEVKAYLSSL